MMHDDRDESLRRAFQELREEDQGDRPSFERLLSLAPGVPRRRSRPAFRRTVGLAVAGLGLVASIALLVLARQARAPVATTTVAALAAWTSPTDTLLRTPGRELSRDLPRLGDIGVLQLGAQEARPTSEPVVPLSHRKETMP